MITSAENNVLLTIEWKYCVADNIHTKITNEFVLNKLTFGARSSNKKKYIYITRALQFRFTN